jgi:hypothetical protein
MEEIRMKIAYISLIMIVLFFMNALCRTGTILDKSGKQEKVIDLEFKKSNDFDNRCIKSDVEALFIRNRNLPIITTIPVASLISISRKGEYDFVFVYLQNGKQVTKQAGLYSGGTWEGKIEIGDYSINPYDIIKITFIDSAVNSNTSQIGTQYTSLVLSNGQIVHCMAFKRLMHYCSSQGYVIGCGEVYEFTSDIFIMNGDASVKVDFNKLSSIVFKDIRLNSDSTSITSGNIQLTAKSGIVYNSTVLISGIPIDGFTGVSQEGPFFVPTQSIKSIDFKNSF